MILYISNTLMITNLPNSKISGCFSYRFRRNISIVRLETAIMNSNSSLHNNIWTICAEPVIGK